MNLSERRYFSNVQRLNAIVWLVAVQKAKQEILVLDEEQGKPDGRVERSFVSGTCPAQSQDQAATVATINCIRALFVGDDFVEQIAIAEKLINEHKGIHLGQEEEKQIAALEAAIISARALNAEQPNNGGDVKAAIARLELAAMAVLALQKETIHHLKNKVTSLEKKSTEQQQEIKLLKDRVKASVGDPSDSDISLRAVKVTPETAPVLAKLLTLKKSIVYEAKRGPGHGVLAWVENNLCGEQPEKLSPAEYEVVLANPSLLKQFDSRLYHTFRLR